MNPSLANFLRIAAAAFATLLVAIPAVWGSLALWYQIPGGQGLKTLSVMLWAAFSLAVLVALWQVRIGLGLFAFAVAFAGLLIWWTRLSPTNDRIWADDVARATTGTIDGNRVTLRNVRNFDWRSPTDYTQH